MLKLLPLSLFAASLFAQTTLTANQVKECPAGITTAVVVMGVPVKLPGSGSVATQTVCAAIDPALFTLDQTTTPPTLRLAASFVLPIFVDKETPGGPIDGTNATFTLANAPSPAASLQISRNGVLQQVGVPGDCWLTVTAAGATSITFAAASIPQPGDVLLASYRH